METSGIVILGSGNVACHIAVALKESGADIIQVYSPDISHARALALSVGARPTDNTEDIVTDAGFYIISVKDSAVALLAERMPHVDGVVVHTSGSVPMDVLLPASDRVGVMYPLQTFSKGRDLDMKTVPFFNEASDTDTLKCIDTVASSISESVHHADSTTRPYLHVAGVLGCNFPNFLLGCAAEVLAKGGYTLDVLRPLLQETVAKAFEFGPDASQTGPAVRGDWATIERHCAILPPEIADIYMLLSKAIMNKYNIQ